MMTSAKLPQLRQAPNAMRLTCRRYRETLLPKSSHDYQSANARPNLFLCDSATAARAQDLGAVCADAQQSRPTSSRDNRFDKSILTLSELRSERARLWRILR